MNSVQILGNLGKDPVLRATKTGRAVASLSVAVNRTFTSPQGEQREITDWVNVTAWGNLAEAAGNQLRKGTRVFVEGRFTTRSYDTPDGQKRWISEVTANFIALPIGMQGNESQQGGGQTQAGWGNSGAPAAGGRTVYSEGPTQRGFGQFGTPQAEKQKMEETSMFPADRQEAVGRAAHPSQCEEDIPF